MASISRLPLVSSPAFIRRPVSTDTEQVFLALAALYPFLSEILYPVKLFVLNHPKLLKEVNEFPTHQVRWPNEVRNCEDVVLDEGTGTAIFSCDPGRDKWNTVMVCNIIWVRHTHT